GIFNESVPEGNPFRGIPYPMTLLVDANGVVKEKQYEEDYRQRYTLGSTLIRQYGIEPQVARGEVKGKLITLHTSARTDVVRVGQRVSLVIDFELPPELHVYAPGTEGYIPVSWTLAESSAFKAHAVDFPRSRTLHLPAINETVPVFEGKVRLIRDVTIGNLRGVQEVPIEGSFRYQACGERLCYPPDTVSVKWNLRVEAMDTERVPEELRRKETSAQPDRALRKANPEREIGTRYPGAGPAPRGGFSKQVPTPYAVATSRIQG